MGEKDKRKAKHWQLQKGTIFFYAFFFFFIGGYLFFFTSRAWMPTTGTAEKVTALNEKISWDDREIKLMRWQYSEEQHLMEVELDITNTTFDGTTSYQFEAMETSAGFLKVVPIIEDSDWVVVQIQDVPEKFAEISFRVENPNDENAGKLRLYTNIQDVERVARLEVKDRMGYRIGRYETEIASYESEIEQLETKIMEEKQKMKNIEAEITKLEEQKEYQTESERENTDSILAEANTELEQSQGRIEQHETDITEYQERIDNIQIQIKELKDE